MREWYDGYRFGDAEVCNSYSITNYASRRVGPKPYWCNTAKDVAIGWLLDRVDQRTFGQIESLVNGDPFEVRLDEALTYDDARVRTGSLYSLMVMAGYLKAVPKRRDIYEVSVIDEAINDAIADAYKDMEDEDSEEPGVGSHNAAYIAGRFWDVARLDELGFPDDASDVAMSVHQPWSLRRRVSLRVPSPGC